MLADLVLSNKLILYDLEKQAIGWTEYNLLLKYCVEG
ncbi:Aspartic proteinase 36 [Orobanche minor]